MKTFNSIEEIKKYYNADTNTYDFIEDGNRLDVEFEFDLNVDSHILARNINAYDIKAWDINANDISYYAVCFAYKNIICTSIERRRDNAKHFVLDGEITIKQPKKKVTLELTNEQLEKVKEMLK
jgi:hypothetical protein